MKRGAGASGERRNAPEEPVGPTEGRDSLRRGVVASLVRRQASHCGPRRAPAQRISGQRVQAGRKMLWGGSGAYGHDRRASDPPAPVARLLRPADVRPWHHHRCRHLRSHRRGRTQRRHGRPDRVSGGGHADRADGSLLCRTGGAPPRSGRRRRLCPARVSRALARGTDRDHHGGNRHRRLGVHCLRRRRVFPAVHRPGRHPGGGPDRRRVYRHRLPQRRPQRRRGRPDLGHRNRRPVGCNRHRRARAGGFTGPGSRNLAANRGGMGRDRGWRLHRLLRFPWI